MFLRSKVYNFTVSYVTNFIINPPKLYKYTVTCVKMFFCVTYLRNYKLCYCKQKRNYGNFHLFAANEKRKRQISLRLLKTEIGSFFSLIGKTIFGNRGLLFQQTCLSVEIACKTGSSTQHVVNYSSIKQRCMNDRVTSF
jgi:hypothetical protein